MSVVDGYVQVAPDSSGKKIDNSELTRDDGAVVERQRTNVADPENTQPSGLAKVLDNKVQVEDRTLHILEHIAETLERIELKLNAAIN